MRQFCRFSHCTEKKKNVIECSPFASQNLKYVGICTKDFDDNCFELFFKNTPKLEHIFIDCITPLTIHHLTTFCPNIIGINLVASKVQNCDLILIGQHYPKLKLLGCNLTLGSISDLGVSQIIDNCPSLTFLDVSWNNHQITDKSIDKIPNCCPAITFLNISGSGVTDPTVENIVNNCKKLEYFDITNCRATNSTVYKIHTSYRKKFYKFRDLLNGVTSL